MAAVASGKVGGDARPTGRRPLRQAPARVGLPSGRPRRVWRQGRLSTGNFYRGALSEAEGLELATAQEIEGLDDEIALLRVLLKKAIEERPEDVQLLVKGLDLLVKAVAARYRLSPKARKDLAENLAATLNSLGDQLLPAAG